MSRFLPLVVVFVLAALASPCAAVIGSDLPSEDPAHSGAPIHLLEPFRNSHPRLLLSPQKIERLRDFYASPQGKPFADALDDYARRSRSATISNIFVSNDTEAQRYGLWQLPTLSLHYLLSGDEGSRDKAIQMLEFLLPLENWQSGRELNCGMGAANVMFGAAVGYDWLYDELEPAFRSAFREKLWAHARAMYYGGHLGQVEGASYWNGDPQNNHRAHSNMGLVAASIAAYEEQPDQMWLMSEVINELAFVSNWLPPDGSSHESANYFVFGLPHAFYSMAMADFALGTTFLDHPYFLHVPMFRVQSLAPGLRAHLPFADDPGNHLGYYNPAVYPLIWLNQQWGLQSIMDLAWSRNSQSFPYTWMALLGDLPSSPEMGSSSALGTLVPLKIRFPDIDTIFMRDGWESSNVGAMFRSAPFGGKMLNAFRDAHDYTYVNVGHDDPDANSFVIWKSGQVAATDGYSTAKQSSNHNTILVNGLGQRVEGRPDAVAWTQPSKAMATMSNMAYVTLWVDAGPIAIAEGEAANSYIDSSLTRYRRAFIWNQGKYILLLDDFRSELQEQITWLVQGETLQVLDQQAGRFQLGNGQEQMPFQVAATTSFSTQTDASTADHQGVSLNLQQLQVTLSTSHAQLASIFAPWGGAPSVEFSAISPDSASVTVTGDGFTDVWEWTFAPDDSSPGVYRLQSSDGSKLNSSALPTLPYLGHQEFRIDEWIYSTWFGYYFPDHHPWLYHESHGYLYMPESIEGGAVFYDSSLGWLWTSNQYYPWLWQYTQDRWIAYISGSHGQRWFGVFQESDFTYFEVE